MANKPPPDMGSAVISKRAMIGNGYCHSRVLIVAGRLWHGRLCQWRRPIAIAHFDEGRRHAAWGLPMSSIARDARLKVAEYEKRAATAHDPETRRHYIQLARDWQDLARQSEQLEADLRVLARKGKLADSTLWARFLLNIHVVA